MDEWGKRSLGCCWWMILCTVASSGVLDLKISVKLHAHFTNYIFAIRPLAFKLVDALVSS